MMENKHFEFETNTDQWAHALTEVEEYLTLSKGATTTGWAANEQLYAPVGIGAYVRFYILPPGQDTLIGEPDTQGRALHVYNDRHRINTLLILVANSI